MAFRDQVTLSSGGHGMYRVMTKQEVIDGFDEAIENEQFYVCYQPQINHLSGNIVGAEALLP